jgi:hypothetical protein
MKYLAWLAVGLIICSYLVVKTPFKQSSVPQDYVPQSVASTVNAELSLTLPY